MAGCPEQNFAINSKDYRGIEKFSTKNSQYHILGESVEKVISFEIELYEQGELHKLLDSSKDEIKI